MTFESKSIHRKTKSNIANYTLIYINPTRETFHFQGCYLYVLFIYSLLSSTHSLLFAHHDYFSIVNFPPSHSKNVFTSSYFEQFAYFSYFSAHYLNKVSSFKITNRTTLGCFDIIVHIHNVNVYSNRCIAFTTTTKKTTEISLLLFSRQNFNSVYLVLFKFFVFTSPTNVCTTCVNHRP